MVTRVAISRLLLAFDSFQERPYSAIRRRQIVVLLPTLYIGHGRTFSAAGLLAFICPNRRSRRARGSSSDRALFSHFWFFIPSLPNESEYSLAGKNRARRALFVNERRQKPNFDKRRRAKGRKKENRRQTDSDRPKTVKARLRARGVENTDFISFIRETFFGIILELLGVENWTMLTPISGRRTCESTDFGKGGAAWNA